MDEKEVVEKIDSLQNIMNSHSAGGFAVAYALIYVGGLIAQAIKSLKS